VIVYFGQFVENYRSRPTICGTFGGKSYLCINFDKKCWYVYILGDFSQTHLVTLTYHLGVDFNNQISFQTKSMELYKVAF
jgi:hypothetical protein